MEYKIGELSRLFNVSKEMIRYYEKQGVIGSVRTSGNNYRTYSIWDIFEFLEMLQYKEFNISLKDLAKCKNENLSEWLHSNLILYARSIVKEIALKTLSCERAQEIIERIECSEMNEGNYWVKKVPQQYLFHFVSSRNDIYNEIDMREDIRRELFSAKVVKFIEPLVQFSDSEEWSYAISKRYADSLNLSFIEEADIAPDRFCLCTVVNMGEIGAFSDQVTEAASIYMKQRGYVRNGLISGLILSRGTEHNNFVRRMEIQIPIQIPKP